MPAIATIDAFIRQPPIMADISAGAADRAGGYCSTKMRQHRGGARSPT